MDAPQRPKSLRDLLAVWEGMTPEQRAEIEAEIAPTFQGVPVLASENLGPRLYYVSIEDLGEGRKE